MTVYVVGNAALMLACLCAVAAIPFLLFRSPRE